MVSRVCWVQGMTAFGIVFCQLAGTEMESIGGYGLVFYFYGVLSVLPVPLIAGILPNLELRPKPPLLNQPA